MAKKSTNGRAVPISLRALRLVVATLARVAPAVAERHAARLFLTPRRRPPRHPDLRRALDVTAPDHPADAPTREMTLQLGGGTVALTRWGHGPRVLLVHGWEGDAADMAPMAAALVRAGFEAVLVDFPAHGRSTGRTTNLVEWMWTIRALEGELGPLRAIVAHSFGGAAVALAMGELGVPADGAVLVAPAASPWDYLHQFARAIALPARHVPGLARRVGERVGRTAETLDPPGAARAIRVPALVLHDPEDAEVPFAHGERIAAGWRGAVLVRRPGTGHRRILRDAESIARTVAFVEGLGERAVRRA